VALGQAARPLSEESLAKLVELQIDDDVIVAKLKGQGLSFTADPSALDRLRKLGASTAVLDAIRNAPLSAAPANTVGRAVTYQDVLNLLQIGLDEKTLLKRLTASPTRFTLDAAQIDALKRAGATDSVIAAMRGGGTISPAPASSGRVTDFAIVLDCSGSMSERTRDGQSKMAEAKRVVSDLIARLPEKLRVALIVYGYDRELNCQAVKVARELAELDASGRAELGSMVAALQPLGGTPIALALECAGRELARNDAYCGLVLISDGKETCGGDPAAVAAGLAGKLKLSFGVNVIGFDVQADERAALADVARAGKGRYYNAQTVAELNRALDGLRKELEVVARPAQTNVRIKLQAARTVKLLPTTVRLPEMESIYLAPPGTDRMALRVSKVARLAKYGESMRIPRSDKSPTFDLWWFPATGRAIRMVKDLPVSAPVEIQPADYLGLVRVTGSSLPKAGLVLLTPVGTADFAIRADAAQTSEGYGKDMVVAPGSYDLWIEPADGNKAEKLVEKVEVTAGKVTVIE
jgi:Mg-chelatase subunit ChlD